ncbi:MAG: hypothetical protein JKY89_05275, partial [Immundisolibacteraceae bacterium]|nr:hypothetical protein [Immundisolibacteraceae bacterium]
MEVKGWLELADKEQFSGIKQMLAAKQKDISEQQVGAVVSCMKTVGGSPIWISETAGTLMVKCGFDMGIHRPTASARLTSVVDCVKQSLPDFSADEFLSVGLSMTGSALAKDSMAQPALTPRTQKIMKAIGGCEQR